MSNANKRGQNEAREETTTIAFRVPKSRRALLEAIRLRRGHAFLSETMDDAVDLLLEAEGLSPKGAPLKEAA